MSPRTLALVTSTLLTLAACDAAGPGDHPATTAGGGDRQALADAAACMRANGFPDYPDPVRTGGRWAFPASAAQLAPKPAPACTDLFRKAGALPAESRRAVSADEMLKLRKWGECVRANGLPDWPDPDGDGIFHPSPMPADDDPRWVRADTACRPLEPGPITVDAGTTAGKNGR